VAVLKVTFLRAAVSSGSEDGLLRSHLFPAPTTFSYDGVRPCTPCASCALCRLRYASPFLRDPSIPHAYKQALLLFLIQLICVLHV
jgi:hypothetical protein